MTTSIRPPYAASIWIADNLLFVELPSTTGEKSHTICLSNDVVGFQKALHMLSHRTERSRLGEAGDPTQHHIDKVPKYDEARVIRMKPKPKFSPQLQSATREVLRKLGMI